MRKPHVLLSGAAGFLGSHLSDLLLSKGYRVTGFDDLSTGSEGNVAHLADNPDFRFVRHDVRLPFDVEALPAEARFADDEGFTHVMNFACPASPPIYQADALGTIDICFLGTRNMLQVAHRHGARFLQASTSEVYGDPDVSPQPETYRGSVSPIGIRACYDEGKRIGETLTFEYERQLGLDVKVVRIFNTYGPRMNPADGRVVSNFVAQALRGDDITIYGDGSQSRSFCFVSDLVSGIVALLESPKGFSGPVNIGNPVEFTMLELAQVVLDVTGSASRLVNEPLPGDDPRQRCPDIDLARRALDWEPLVPLRQGVEIFAEHFRREYGFGVKTALKAA